MPTTPITITCFSDILCVWAYIAERRLQEVKDAFGEKVKIDYRFISLFGDTQTKFGAGWQERGGFEGYAAHVSDVVSGFDHVDIHRDTWSKTRPPSSSGIHLLAKAVQLSSSPGSDKESNQNTERLIRELRKAFFTDAQNIAEVEVQMEIVQRLGLPGETITSAMEDGTAFAALNRDEDAGRTHKIEGSPTYLLNQGRQKLYGNVGFRIIEANILELLRKPSPEQASWC